MLRRRGMSTEDGDRTKVLLLGMNNPLSNDPDFDLYPYPEGSTGYRLWKMLPEGTSRQDYLKVFDRRNLLRAREWDPTAAHKAAIDLWPELDGRVVVVLGTQVRNALGLQAAEPLLARRSSIFLPAGLRDPSSELKAYNLRWVAFPHPSGRNRWFNDPANRYAACRLFHLLFTASAVGAVETVWRELTK